MRVRQTGKTSSITGLIQELLLVTHDKTGTRCPTIISVISTAARAASGGRRTEPVVTVVLTPNSVPRTNLTVAQARSLIFEHMAEIGRTSELSNLPCRITLDVPDPIVPFTLVDLPGMTGADRLGNPEFQKMTSKLVKDFIEAHVSPDRSSSWAAAVFKSGTDLSNTSYREVLGGSLQSSKRTTVVITNVDSWHRKSLLDAMKQTGKPLGDRLLETILTCGLHTDESNYEIPIWLLSNPGSALNAMATDPAEAKRQIAVERDSKSDESQTAGFVQMLRSIREDTALKYEQDEKCWTRIENMIGLVCRWAMLRRFSLLLIAD